MRLLPFNFGFSLSRVVLKSNFKVCRSLRTDCATMVKFLNQTEAINIDKELFNQCKFSVDQLMELAGLSCANAVSTAYPIDKGKRVLVCCGPGNNGGDGLVCARHLKHYGYDPTVYYPKRTEVVLYNNLIEQCKSLDIDVLDDGVNKSFMDGYNLIIDAVFGFSFKPPIRPNFEQLIQAMRETKTPICSVDIPSGWHVEEGPPDDGICPEMLISLTAPKLCAKHFKGKYHYLGGRFVPFALAKKYELDLPMYSGTFNIVDLAK